MKVTYVSPITLDEEIITFEQAIIKLIDTIDNCQPQLKDYWAKLGFVVRDYADYFGYNYLLSQDLTKIAEEIFGKTKSYKIKLSQMKTKRSPKKLAMGNYETLCVYEKG